MTARLASPAAPARGLAETAEVLALAALILVAASALTEVLGAPAIRALREAGPIDAAALALAVLQRAILYAPALLLAVALWELHAALGAYARGELFAAPAAARVCAAGEWFVWSAVTDIAIAPNAYAYATQRPGGFAVKLDAADLAVIGLGVFAMLAGRLFEAAAAVKAENDQIV